MFERLYGAGLRQFHVDATCSEDIYHPELRFWHGPDRFDGSFQDEYLRHITAGCTDAFIQLRVYLGAPEWWLDLHPDELQMYDDGTVSRFLQRAGERRLPSLASRVWRLDICNALIAYVEWLKSSGWSRRVSALFLGYGITWEWGLLGSDGFLDYSRPAREYFREWLWRKYGTDAALRDAWGSDVTIASAEIPHAEKRNRPAGPDGYRKGPEEQDVVDHQLSLSDMNAEVLLAAARAAKHASKRKVLVGAFYGYTLTARDQEPFSGLYGAGGFVGGHHSLSRVLRSENVDFLASPFSYADRDLGTGLLIEHVPLASLQAHGKAFFDENDLYPHTNQPRDDDRAKSISVGIARTPRETILYTRLAFMQAVVRGKHQWLTELTGWVGSMHDNFSDPGQLEEIRRLNELADPLLRKNRTPVAEVAFAIDEKGIAHLTLDNKWYRDAVYKGSISWAHTGVPFDVILLDDLFPSENRYQLVVPLAVFDAQRAKRLDLWKAANPQAKVFEEELAKGTAAIPQLLSAYAEAGVHRYVEDGVTVWANASMVGVHVHADGPRTIRFKHSVAGVEIFSGREFNALQGRLEWQFEPNDVALFAF